MHLYQRYKCAGRFIQFLKCNAIFSIISGMFVEQNFKMKNLWADFLFSKKRLFGESRFMVNEEKNFIRTVFTKSKIQIVAERERERQGAN